LTLDRESGGRLREKRQKKKKKRERDKRIDKNVFEVCQNRRRFQGHSSEVVKKERQKERKRNREGEIEMKGLLETVYEIWPNGRPHFPVFLINIDYVLKQ
jgi:hypothetical protein